MSQKKEKSTEKFIFVKEGKTPDKLSCAKERKAADKVPCLKKKKITADKVSFVKNIIYNRN